MGRPPLAPAHDSDLGSPKRVPQNQNAQLVLSLGPHNEGHHGKFGLESGAASPFTQVCVALVSEKVLVAEANRFFSSGGRPVIDVFSEFCVALSPC